MSAAQVPLFCLWSFPGLNPVCLCLSGTREPTPEPSTSGMVSPVLRREGTAASSCWEYLVLIQHGIALAFLPQGHTVDSCSTWCPPGPFLSWFFPVGQLQASTGAGLCISFLNWVFLPISTVLWTAAQSSVYQPLLPASYFLHSRDRNSTSKEVSSPHQPIQEGWLKPETGFNHQVSFWCNKLSL